MIPMRGDQENSGPHGPGLRAGRLIKHSLRQMRSPYGQTQRLGFS